MLRMWHGNGLLRIQLFTDIINGDIVYENFQGVRQVHYSDIVYDFFSDLLTRNPKHIFDIALWHDQHIEFDYFWGNDVKVYPFEDVIPLKSIYFIDNDIKYVVFNYSTSDGVYLTYSRKSNTALKTVIDGKRWFRDVVRIL